MILDLRGFIDACISKRSSHYIAVTDGLPRRSDCDEKGRCWLTTTELEPGWVLDNPEQCTNWTHWRPFNSIPHPLLEKTDDRD
jgi:hypothetical protein